ncbi:hypothetical protein BGZ72_003688 [Mortierella alpina]|nr:hypothetical protein BGZ72_003688 [Mortierella alpina]
MLTSCKGLALSLSDSQDPRLKNPTLTASCQDDDGEWNLTSLNLDQVLANIFGKFVWGDHNFSRSAYNIQLDSQTADLSASLLTNERDANNVEKANSAKVNLAERIRNDNGQLTFVPAAGRLLDHTV